jgi:predicted RNA-binding protein with RPS1 domain
MNEDEHLIIDIKKIENNFLKKIDKLLSERDKKIKIIIKNNDEEEIKNISTSLNF